MEHWVILEESGLVLLPLPPIHTSASAHAKMRTLEIKLNIASSPFPHRLTIYFYIPARFAAKNRAPVKRGNNFCPVPRFFSLPYFKIITQQIKNKIQNNSTVFYTLGIHHCRHSGTTQNQFGCCNLPSSWKTSNDTLQRWGLEPSFQSMWSDPIILQMKILGNKLTPPALWRL